MKKSIICILLSLTTNANAGDFFEDSFSLYIGVMTAGGSYVITEARKSEIEAQVKRDIANRLEQSAVSIRDTKRTILQNEEVRLTASLAVSQEMVLTLSQTRDVMKVIQDESTRALSSGQRMIYGFQRLMGLSEARSEELKRLQDLLQSRSDSENVSLAEVNALLIGENNDLQAFATEVREIMSASSTMSIRKLQSQSALVDGQLSKISVKAKVYSDQLAFQLQSVKAQLVQIQ